MPALYFEFYKWFRKPECSWLGPILWPETTGFGFGSCVLKFEFHGFVLVPVLEIYSPSWFVPVPGIPLLSVPLFLCILQNFFWEISLSYKKDVLISTIIFFQINPAHKKFSPYLFPDCTVTSNYTSCVQGATWCLHKKFSFVVSSCSPLQPHIAFFI